MFNLNSSNRYYFYSQATDMRKSFDALSGLVQSKFTRNPRSGEVFVFINRRRNCIKLLHWESGGFVLYYKRLEQGTLEIPKESGTNKTIEITWPELVLIIEGIPLKYPPKRKRYSYVV